VKVLAQRGELMAPGIPELRKAVQEDNQVIAAAAFGVMQPNTVNGRVSVTNRGHWLSQS
jgi:hypothetical protein